MLSTKNILRIVINTSIGVGLIFLWLKLVDLNQILKSLSQLNVLFLIPFFLFFALASVLRSIRLKILLSEHKIPLKDLIPLTFLSQFLSFTIPLRIGEISKAVYLSSEYQIPFAKSVVWIFLDRFIDFWLVLIFVLVLLFSVPTNIPESLINILLSVLLGFSFAGTLALFMPNLSKKLVKLFSHLLIFSLLKRHFNSIANFLLDTTSLLKKGFGSSLSIVLLTVGAWLSEMLLWMLLYWGLGVSPNFFKIYLGSLLSALSYLIPSAPGYVGSAEASGLAIFHYMLGLEKTLTSAVIVLNHGLTLICLLIFGLVSLYILKFDLNLVWKKLKKE